MAQRKIGDEVKPDESVPGIDLSAVRAPGGLSGLTRRDILWRTGAAGLVLALPGGLAACGSSESNSSVTGSSGATGKAGSAEIDHITWGVKGGAPRALDISRDWTVPDLTASSLAVEALFTTGPNLELRPLLASGFSQPDPTHYVIQLRPGVKFWDGTPLTVDDVVYSITRNQDEELGSPIGFLFEKVESVKAKGTNRIEITLSEPEPSFPQILTLPQVVSKKYTEAQGDGYGGPGSKVKVLGTGPYKVTAFTTGGGVSLVRNEAYWGEKPKVKAVTLKYFEDPQTMLLAARGEEIDGAFGFPLSEADTWNSVGSLETQFNKENGLSSIFLSLDMESEPWSDIHVRRALAYCADTAGYTKAFLSDQANPATSPIPQGQWSDVASESETAAIYKAIPQYPYSIAKAKEELAKSAFPNGFSADLPYNNAFPEIGKALVSLSQSMKQIGVNLKVKALPESAWIAAILKHENLGVQTFWFGPDYNDPSDFMGTIYPSAAAVENAFNTANFKNPKVDQLLKEQTQAPNKKARAKMLGEIVKISGEELPYVPLWWEGPSLAASTKYVFNGFSPLYYYQAWLKYLGTRA